MIESFFIHVNTNSITIDLSGRYRRLVSGRAGPGRAGPGRAGPGRAGRGRLVSIELNLIELNWINLFVLSDFYYLCEAPCGF